MKASILISSFNRLPLFKRCLRSIVNNEPKIPYEVIIADDSSSEDILGELQNYNGFFNYKFIRVNSQKFEHETGYKHFFNNASLTNNVAFMHSTGDLIFLMGNEIIAYDDVFNTMIKMAPKKNLNYLVVSTTFDIPEYMLAQLDEFGENIDDEFIQECSLWPLASLNYHSDVTNYISLCSRELFSQILYDETFVRGIGCEDSDFVRRAKLLPNFKMIRGDHSVLSLHQFHGGKTKYYDPKPQIIQKTRWDTGLGINRAHYNSWDGKRIGPAHTWKTGSIGVEDIIENVL